MVDGEVDVAFLIADLAGYTALTEAHGGTQAARVVRRYADLAEAAARPGVAVVERVGDELLIAGAEPPAVLETAIRLRDDIEAEPMFPAVRMGLHAGSVLRSAGRYYGTALNLTARLAAYARPGQILCSGVIAPVCEARGVSCRGLGPVRFRNIPQLVAVFEITVSHPMEAHGAIDPVCRMQVSPTTAPARLPYGGAVYLFCSFECARTFASAPDQYAPPTAPSP